MDKQIYNNKMHKLLLYIFMLLPLIILTKYVLQGSLNELNGINYVLCIISLPCSFLYYKLKKQKNLFLYLLIYESIVIEHFAYIILFKTEVTSINSVFLTPYIFRSILLLAIFCSNDKILNYINSRKKLSIILCFIVNIILIYHNNFVVRQFNIRNLKDFFYSSIVILTD